MSYGGDNTAAIVGGVLGTVTLLAIIGMMIVVVILMRNCGWLYFTGMKNKYVFYNNYICEGSRAIHS